MRYLYVPLLLIISFSGAFVVRAEVTTTAVQGYKVDQSANVFDPGATITVQGVGSFTGNPYNSGQIPAGTYTVTSSVPSGYTVSYSTNPGAGVSSYTTGSSVTLNLPADGYKDLWWRYTPVVSKGAVQGYKVDQNGSIFDPGSTITVSGAGSFSQNPYNSGQINAGTYTVTSSVPSGYTVSYSRNPGAGASSYTSGASATVSISNGGAVDLWFKYTPRTTTPVTPVIPSPGPITQPTPVTVGKVIRDDQKEVLDLNNVYSPEIVKHGSTRYMYFGGWKNEGQTHDNIYRARCGNLGDSCRGIETLIDSDALGFDHLNDPSIVQRSDGSHIMYMTAAAPGAGFDTDAAVIYTSVSEDDGKNWTDPTKLVTRAWLPSATIGRSGAIELFGNDTLISGNVFKFKLTNNGENWDESREPLVFSNNGFYQNVDIKYRPSLRLYQMFGERQGSTAIDYLTSTDGIRFTLVASDVVTSDSAGVAFIRTPGQDSETASWLYYAGTNNANSTENRIFFQTWELGSAPTAQTSSVSVISSTVATKAVVPNVKPTNSSGAITTVLSQGMSGQDVTRLQAFLAQDSGLYPEGTVSGYFGPATRQAVIRFQNRYVAELLTPAGLVSGTGYVGPLTLKKINALLQGTSAATGVLTATPLSGKRPLTVSFSAYSDGASEYYIDFGDRKQEDLERISGICLEGAGGPCNGGADLLTTHVYKKKGTYTARLYKRYTCEASEGTSCIALESEQVAEIRIRVR